MHYTIRIRPRTLVMLVGPSGSGKSTFAHNHFIPSEIVSSALCRLYVCDDETNQKHNKAVFNLFHEWIRCRMEADRVVVADATNLSSYARDKLYYMARHHRYEITVILMDTPLSTCLSNNTKRERVVPPEVIERHHAQMERAIRVIEEEFVRGRYNNLFHLGPNTNFEVIKEYL